MLNQNEDLRVQSTAINCDQHVVRISELENNEKERETLIRKFDQNYLKKTPYIKFNMQYTLNYA